MGREGERAVGVATKRLKEKPTGVGKRSGECAKCADGNNSAGLLFKKGKLNACYHSLIMKQ